jgi:hypothetical protein
MSASSKQTENRFQIGDIVIWTSKAGGNTKKKIGVVIEVVPAGQTPTTCVNLSTRRHESYVILVPRKSRARRNKSLKPSIYWPHASLLRP